MSESAGPDFSENAALRALIADYPPGNGCYDEMMDGSRGLRPHYRQFLEHVVAEDGPGLMGHRFAAESIIRRDGVTYNVYGDPKGLERLWALDLLPLILTAREWARIESGIRQRLMLLNHLLADLYGPRRLLSRNAIPPEFVMANPRYLHACHGIGVPRAGHIVCYAADLVRDASGAWRVLGDRTQTPSGAGYALENRIVMARTFPNLIQDAQVQRLANFFEHLDDALRIAVPRRRETPAIVMLTPGPLNETYFEQVYLARYLGYPLVEGEDLTVRDNRVYLRTIEGLEQVDVILRRVDDSFCDPLELRRDSILGTAGLLQALRNGTVSVCNAPGSGVLEVPAIKAVLARVCRQVLGEDLLLPCTPVLWGALPEHREAMDAQFDPAQMSAAFGAHGAPDPGNPADLLEHWRERPYDITMQEPVSASRVPVLGKNGLSGCSLVLRVYAAVNGDTGEIHVMPGGLARFSAGDDVRNITMQHGSGSKDVWVLADGPAAMRDRARNPNAPVILERSPNNLASRMAENLFWLGRYCVRCEDSVRRLRQILIRTTEDDWTQERADLRRMVDSEAILLQKLAGTVFTAAGEVSPQADRARMEALQRAIAATMQDGGHPNGVVAMVHAIRRALWIVRERFSEDDWRIMNGFTQDFLDRAGGAQGVQAVLDAFNDLVTGFAAFSGLTSENMTREPGQFFLEIGCRVERASNAVSLAQRWLAFPLEDETALLASLLAVFDGPMTYRARYGAALQVAPVLDLILADDTNPRSAAFQLARLARRLPELPKSGGAGLLNAEERVLERMRAELRTIDMHALAQPEPGPYRRSLAEFCALLCTELPRFAEMISQRYFMHTEPAQQLGAAARVTR